MAPGANLLMAVPVGVSRTQRTSRTVRDISDQSLCLPPGWQLGPLSAPRPPILVCGPISQPAKLPALRWAMPALRPLPNWIYKVQSFYPRNMVPFSTRAQRIRREGP